jgi:DNA-binding transcriptional regulator LsrR (DeoR family)
MSDWWSELDEAILGCFTANRPLAPAAIGRKLGMSEAGIVSILAMLAREGRVRITLVELPADGGGNATAK